MRRPSCCSIPPSAPPTGRTPSTGSRPRRTARWSPSAPAKAAARTPSCGCSTPPTAVIAARRSPTPGRAAWRGSPTAPASPTPDIRRATSTTAPCTTTCSARRGPTIPSCGPSTPTRRRGPTSRCRPTARGCSSTSASVGRAIDVHLLERATGRWTTAIAGDGGHHAACGSPPTGRRSSGSRRSTRRRAVSCGCHSTRPPPPAGPRSSPRGDAVLGSVAVRGDDLLVTATRRAVDTVQRHGPDGTPLGAVVRDRRRHRRRRAQRRPRHR